MAKNIIFCADGTWNGPGQDDDKDGVPDPTNVFKLYANLEGDDSAGSPNPDKERERVLVGENGAVEQVAKYLHGVGHSSNRLVQWIGGGLGTGLVARVLRGYTFISRNYEQDDRIFLVGFSRGAYTARALAGLINAEGLLDASQLNLQDKEQTYQLASAVWYDYRKQKLHSDKKWFATVQETVARFPDFLRTAAGKAPTPHLLAGVEIEAVAVWDTVGSLGIPMYALAEAEESKERIDGFQFADRTLSENVLHGLHAVAIDERRSDFPPTLWEPSSRVTQVLFAGAHSDVGGGYTQNNAQSGLSDCALKWMMQKLAALGVSYSPAMPYSPKHDAAGTGHEPWREPPFVLLGKQERNFSGAVRLHQSVIDRINAGAVVPHPEVPPAPYAPKNLSKHLLPGGKLGDLASVEAWA